MLYLFFICKVISQSLFHIWWVNYDNSWVFLWLKNLIFKWWTFMSFIIKKCFISMVVLTRFPTVKQYFILVYKYTILNSIMKVAITTVIKYAFYKAWKQLMYTSSENAKCQSLFQNILWPIMCYVQCGLMSSRVECSAYDWNSLFKIKGVLYRNYFILICIIFSNTVFSKLIDYLFSRFDFHYLPCISWCLLS